MQMKFLDVSKSLLYSCEFPVDTLIEVIKLVVSEKFESVI